MPCEVCFALQQSLAAQLLASPLNGSETRVWSLDDGDVAWLELMERQHPLQQMMVLQ